MNKTKSGSILLNDSLKELVAKGLVTKEEAVLHAYDKESLLKELSKIRSW